MNDKLLSFEELHLEYKQQGLVKTEQETEAILILFCREGYLEKQVFKDTNTIWYRRTGKTPPPIRSFPAKFRIMDKKNESI